MEIEQHVKNRGLEINASSGKYRASDTNVLWALGDPQIAGCEFAQSSRAPIKKGRPITVLRLPAGKLRWAVESDLIEWRLRLEMLGFEPVSRRRVVNAVRLLTAVGQTVDDALTVRTVGCGLIFDSQRRTSAQT